MAERPVFIPAPDAPGFVIEKSFSIKWAGGFAVAQKKKNIKALHLAAEADGFGPILEASTKSDEKLGQRLSAFNLKVHTNDGDLPLECAYQGSKVFEKGGPYNDLFFVEPKIAKRDPRLHSSGKLIAFWFDGHKFPLEPRSAFYDWLYITAIFPHRDFLFRHDRLPRYAGFTDIEFNPSKSINCQARSCALFVSLKEKHLLEEAIQSPESFIAIVSRRKRLPEAHASVVKPEQGDPFADANPTGTANRAKLADDASPKAMEADLQPQGAGQPTVEEQAIQPSADATFAPETREDRGALTDHRGTPPSNFELFVKEKAARQAKRQIPAKRIRTKKKSATGTTATLKLPTPR